MISTVSVLAAASKPDTSTYTVLVVDDERDIREAVRHLLERALPNVKVRTADGGAAGLEILRQGGVDLIVTDYKMPGMNGVEFLAKARAIAPSAPRILITAFEAELAKELGTQGDVSHIFTKPLAPRPLVQTCRQILSEGSA